MYRVVASISNDEQVQHFLLLVGGGQEGIVKHMSLILAEYNPPQLPLTKGEKYKEMLLKGRKVRKCHQRGEM